MILFLGQHFKYKGYREILKSAKIVWQQFPDTHFVFIGPQYKKAKKFFELFKNEKRIVSLGFVNLEEKTNAIASCHQPRKVLGAYILKLGRIKNR